MGLLEYVEPIIDTFWPGHSHGGLHPSEGQLGQPAPEILNLGQPAPEGGQLGQPVSEGGQLGQPVPTPVPDTAHKLEDPKPHGDYAAFSLPASNRRPLPADLTTFNILIEASVNTGTPSGWSAINFQEESNFDYVIHLHFNNLDDKIYFSQKYKNKWDPNNASSTEFTLKQASYKDHYGVRKLRVVVSWSEEQQAFVFSFLGENWQWLEHKYNPGQIPIKFLYHNGWKDNTGAILNDIAIIPIPTHP